MPMFMKDDGTPKKTLYHSDISKAGGITLRLRGDVREGKYGWTVPVNIQGDPSGHDMWFTLENDNCIQRMQLVNKDEWGVLTAAGSRGAASLSWQALGTPGAPLPPEAYSDPYTGAIAPAPAPTAPQQPRQPAAPSPSHELLMTECMMNAGRIAQVFRNEFGRDPDDTDQKIAVTLFIAATGR